MSAPKADQLRERLARIGLSICFEREVDSTNTHLARLRAEGQAIDVVLAESQSAGRGRRGRQWISPPGGGLYLSLYRAFSGPVRRLEALSLTAGLATATAIDRCCETRCGLKWPNDIQINGRKLAGCLIDLIGSNDRAAAIIGIGINVDLHDQTGLDQPWTDLVTAAGHLPEIHQLAAAVVEQLIEDLNRFDHAGFAALHARWSDRDILCGRDVTVSGPGENMVCGRALGVDKTGRLVIQTPERRHFLHGGENTIRIV